MSFYASNPNPGLLPDEEGYGGEPTDEQLRELWRTGRLVVVQGEHDHAWDEPCWRGCLAQR